ncbi:DUF4232 domain-containing protein [Nocardia sp. alder85J]|uniref:DUF4232 domain-containing protein n=1 Tax=Nocardia sp. alder85J TaxID=2862949 RepID=UPI001CD212C3|nr:DUF4232 domain-containing protein [Nocardia sp. alder85J]MCX4091988.1 DUF4232 domain-containing protein [Nocardia sp. alder85J]
MSDFRPHAEDHARQLNVAGDNSGPITFQTTVHHPPGPKLGWAIIIGVAVVVVLVIAAILIGGDRTTRAPTTAAPAVTTTIAAPAPAPSASQAAPPAPATAVTSCHTADLRISLAGSTSPLPGTEQQVAFQNISAHPCTLLGFPDIEMIGQADSGPEDVHLPTTTYKPAILETLLPQQTVTDTIVNIYVRTPADPDRATSATFVPAHLLVTPPGETGSVTLGWPWPRYIVDDLFGATHLHPALLPIGVPSS